MSSQSANQVLDQTIAAVLVTVGFFYAFEFVDQFVPPYKTFENPLISGTRSTRQNLWKTLVANWYCWPGKSLHKLKHYKNF